MKVFTQDNTVNIDGDIYKCIIGAEVPKNLEKWFEKNCSHYVKVVEGPKPKRKEKTETGAKQSRFEKAAKLDEATKK